MHTWNTVKLTDDVSLTKFKMWVSLSLRAISLLKNAGVGQTFAFGIWGTLQKN